MIELVSVVAGSLLMVPLLAQVIANKHNLVS